MNHLLLLTLAIIIALLSAWTGYRLARRRPARPTSIPAAGDSSNTLRPGQSDAQRERLSERLLELATTTVDDIMIPRAEIAYLDCSDDWDSILETLRTTPHTRLPVCQGNLDNVVGMLHMKKVAHSLARGGLDREQLLELARERESYFVPEGTALNVQLLNFQRDRRRIALVVDEYGDLRGLVTLEDILEEIVGEFTSAPAALYQDIHRDSDGSYVVHGTASMRTLNRSLGWNLPTNGPRTFNGLILEYLETIPKPGTRLTLGELTIEVLQTAGNSVRTARVRTQRQPLSERVA